MITRYFIYPLIALDMQYNYWPKALKHIYLNFCITKYVDVVNDNYPYTSND